MSKTLGSLTRDEQRRLEDAACGITGHSDKRQVKTVFHAGDGTVYLYDQTGQDIETWPSDWPKSIGCVQTFCRERGINYRS